MELSHIYSTFILQLGSVEPAKEIEMFWSN